MILVKTMECNCLHNHSHKLTINKAFKADPTKTLTLRKRFVAEASRRMRQISKEIITSVYVNDAFGLDSGSPQIKTLAAAQAGEFAFAKSADKTRAFLRWLKEQQKIYLLTGGKKGLVVYGEVTIANYENLWANSYIQSAYQKGIWRARQELKKAGMAIPQFEGLMPGQDEIALAFNLPIHTDRVASLYLRTYNDLAGITHAMDQQMSRVFASGILDGRNPLEVSRTLTAVIEGGGKSLGLTDVLGRYIPTKRRAEMLARTEIIRAHHEANITEYERAGVQGVTIRAEWLTAGDDKVCEICSGLEGQVFSLEEIRPMIPAHPNCRCVAIPYEGDLLKDNIKTLGGKGSGNFGHVGRPGSVGGSSKGGLWSDRKTVVQKIGDSEVILDEGIKDLVVAFNKVGLTTIESDSGHTGKKEAAASFLSFKHIGYRLQNKSVDSIEKLIDSNRLKHDWVLKKFDSSNRFELFLKKGLFGSGKLKSTDTVFKKVQTDFDSFIEILKN